MIILIHFITNFCISYRTEGVTANKDEWTAGKFAVSAVDALSSWMSPIFPRTMLKTSAGSTLILAIFLGNIPSEKCLQTTNFIS